MAKKLLSMLVTQMSNNGRACGGDLGRKLMVNNYHVFKDVLFLIKPVEPVTHTSYFRDHFQVSQRLTLEKSTFWC